MKSLRELFDPDRVSSDEHLDDLAGLRSQGPVVEVEGMGRRRTFIALSHAAVKAGALMSARFGTGLDDAVEAGDDGVPFASLHWADGDAHRTLRTAFSPLASTDGVRARAREVARAQLVGRSELDLVDDVAMPVARAIARPRLGIDDGVLEEALDLARAEAYSHHAADPQRAWTEASQTLVALCRDQLARPAPRAGGGGARGIVRDLVDKGTLPMESAAYVLRFITTTLAETTTLAIAGSLLRFVREGRATKSEDEMLRVLSPVARFGRVALEETTLDGVVVPRHARVILSFAAANHDPRVFPNPRTIDASRASIPHVAFGAGPHVCLGAPVARATLAGVLEEIGDDMKRFSIVDVVPLRSTVNRGVRHARVKAA